MKLLLPLAVAAGSMLGFSSCCCMFGGAAKAEYQNVQKRVCGKHTVTETVYVPGEPVTDAKGGMAKAGMPEARTVKREVVRYKSVKEKVPCQCLHWYCPDEECCGTTGPKIRSLASAQGWTGSPHVGLIPTMKPLAP